MGLFHNYVTMQKMAKGGPLYREPLEGKQNQTVGLAIQEIRKCVPLHRKIVNKPHQSFLVLSSRGTSRNVTPSVQSTPTRPPHFCHFCIIFALRKRLIGNSACINRWIDRKHRCTTTTTHYQPKGAFYVCCTCPLPSSCTGWMAGLC